MKKYVVLAGCLVLIAALMIGCSSNSATAAAEGDTVTVHYTGTLDDGTVFDSSVEGEPLTFVIGDGSMIVGFDKAVRGMEVGDTKTVTIPADEAYGEPDESLIVTLDLSQVGEGVKVGDLVQLVNAMTQEVRFFTVVAVTETTVTLDGNASLAGEDLTFEIEMLAIEKAVVEEGAD